MFPLAHVHEVQLVLANVHAVIVAWGCVVAEETRVVVPCVAQVRPTQATTLEVVAVVVFRAAKWHEAFVGI